MCTYFQTKRLTLNFWAQIFRQNGQLLVFRPKFGEIVQLHEYLGPNIVEGVAESWVETGMSWVEVKMSWMGVDGAGWSWVQGLVIPLPAKKKNCYQIIFLYHP